jgi:hypothetical protein
MSDCDVCLDASWDGETPEFCETTRPKARREHTCCECGRTVAIGEQYESVVGKWDGEISRFRTCAECAEIKMVFYCEGGFIFQCLWEDMTESAFPRLTTASPCFRELSAKAKEFLLRKWGSWKLAPRANARTEQPASHADESEDRRE